MEVQNLNLALDLLVWEVLGDHLEVHLGDHLEVHLGDRLDDHLEVHLGDRLDDHLEVLEDQAKDRLVDYLEGQNLLALGVLEATLHCCLMEVEAGVH